MIYKILEGIAIMIDPDAGLGLPSSSVNSQYFIIAAHCRIYGVELVDIESWGVGCVESEC